MKYQQFIYCKEYLKNKALQDSDSTIDKVVLRKEYDELKILFTNTDDKGKVWEDKYWYRGGLRAAASEGKFIKQYEFCYKIGSDFVHSSSKIGQFYVDLQNKEDTIKAIIGAKAQTNIDPIVVFNAMYLMLCAIGAVNDRFEVMEKDVFEYWDKRLSSKMEKHAMRD
ncbi:hypothetical protein EG832_15675 [bacterium]|nr:hypothetical protein [bacterium]